MLTHPPYLSRGRGRSGPLAFRANGRGPSSRALQRPILSTDGIAGDAARDRLTATSPPHGSGIREMRPFGSTIWQRWPEFGVALTPKSPKDRSELEWGHWRGPRDVRLWPNRIQRGQQWPWSCVWDAGMPSEKALGLDDDWDDLEESA